MGGEETVERMAEKTSKQADEKVMEKIIQVKKLSEKWMKSYRKSD